MAEVRLGKIHLHWCDNCNLPIVNEGTCDSCRSEARKVKITPPGDVRPAFEDDLLLIKETIDRQWGKGYSEEILSTEKPVLLNGIPYLDRMDEVIVDGHVIGALRYNPKRKLKGKNPYEFLLRPWEGLEKPKEGFVVIDEGAVEPILDGGSVLTPGIVDADPSIEPLDEVIIISPSEEVICSGPAKLSGQELIEHSSGRGVKNRWRRSEYTPSEKEPSWNEVVKANEKHIEKRVNKAIRFVKDQIEKKQLPVAAAYSGGKDSLATLHILLDAGVEPDLLFIDTGIELPETIENVNQVADKYELTLHKRKAGSGYWDNVEYFGPSARDYRWCCKTCKLGPTALLIEENYEDGVLSFIGQRRYESRQRMSQGSTWNNPWVPGQVSASPIQDWTALHVWLYLFYKDAEWNEWYEKGFERIGCWVCPASDMAELERLKEEFPEYERFEKILKDYAERNELPEEWKELGLWRWLNIPEEMEKILEDEMDGSIEQVKEKKEGKHRPSLQEMLEDERTRNLLNALIDFERRSIEELDPEEVLPIYEKAVNCVECGVCVGRCEKDALYFEDGVKIDTKRCIHCGECLGKCPAVRFDSRASSCELDQ
ncbi:MAG: phosphoadenosine phosphosulfate reductase family protein [Candidatus Thermoplasmatota archaeon]|nr:phosphoadenosine phosphosulfate reductase family protein [Candidatus Thermoplasmatota archaeon]